VAIEIIYFIFNIKQEQTVSLFIEISMKSEYCFVFGLRYIIGNAIKW